MLSVCSVVDFSFFASSQAVGDWGAGEECMGGSGDGVAGGSSLILWSLIVSRLCILKIQTADEPV